MEARSRKKADIYQSPLRPNGRAAAGFSRLSFQNMTVEQFINPIDRYLKILGRVSDKTLSKVSLAQPEVSSAAVKYNPSYCRALFLGSAYGTIPVGMKYDMLFPYRTPSTGKEVYTEIIAITNYKGEVLISIPNKWETIVLVYFQSGNASILDSVPVVDTWDKVANPLCISNRQTWNLRCDKQFGKL